MKRAVMIGLLGLILAASQVLRPRLIPGAENTLDVAGDITLLPQDGAQQPITDASNVVIWLVPLDSPAFVPTAERPTTYRMVQHDKKFEPELLVVPLGSSVRFPNLDPWFHNVFSLYRGKRFDLGLYQAGDEKTVRFDRPGPSYIFCNIHPQMAAVILTVNSQYYGLTNKSGHISISGVPAGKYAMHVWYENAEPAAFLRKLDRDIAVMETEGVAPCPQSRFR